MTPFSYTGTGLRLTNLLYPRHRAATWVSRPISGAQKAQEGRFPGRDGPREGARVGLPTYGPHKRRGPHIHTLTTVWDDASDSGVHPRWY